MPRRVVALACAVFVFVPIVSAQNLVPACPVPTPTAIGVCPLTGCTSRVADSLLNQAKNRTDTPISPDDDADWISQP